MANKLKVGVVGATGMVGQRFVSLLADQLEHIAGADPENDEVDHDEDDQRDAHRQH